MSAAPPGWHTITPRIFAPDPEGLVAFLRDVFGATGEYDGSRPAEVKIGDSRLLVSGTADRPAVAAFLYVYVADVDGAFERAVARGAVALESPRDVPYGERRGMFEDAWGNTWQVARVLPASG